MFEIVKLENLVPSFSILGQPDCRLVVQALGVVRRGEEVLDLVLEVLEDGEL